VIDFERLKQSELLSIWDSANCFEWNDLLGEKPDDFDSLPECKFWWQFWIKKTKSNYTSPIWSVTESLLPEQAKREYILYKNAKELENSEIERFKLLMMKSEYPIDPKSRKTILEYFAKQPD
jgi:hypothetical protein